jgi:hypothetical protein
MPMIGHGERFDACLAMVVRMRAPATAKQEYNCDASHGYPLLAQ